jgi:hypothetical protein
MNKRVWISALALVAAAGAAHGQAFRGNLAVSQIGRLTDGTAQGSALSSAGTTTSIRDYSASLLSATLNQTYYFNDGQSGTRLVSSGTATSSSYLRTSVNGGYLTIAGYDAALGTTGITSSASSTINRVIGRLDVATGAIAYTRIADPGYSGDNIRSVITTDGSQYWTGGTATVGANGGVRHLLHDESTPQASTQLSANVTNTRNVDIYNGQLYISTGSGAFNGVNTVGVGLPTSSGNTITNFPGHDSFDTALSSYDYFLADSSTLYVADDRSSGNGGLQKWAFNGTNWSLLWTLRNFDANNDGTLESSAMGIRGLTGQVEADGSVSLFAITNNHNFGGTGVNSLVSFSDLLSGTALPANPAFYTLDHVPRRRHRAQPRRRGPAGPRRSRGDPPPAVRPPVIPDSSPPTRAVAPGRSRAFWASASRDSSSG